MISYDLPARTVLREHLVGAERRIVYLRFFQDFVIAAAGNEGPRLVVSVDPLNKAYSREESVSVSGQSGVSRGLQRSEL